MLATLQPVPNTCEPCRAGSSAGPTACSPRQRGAAAAPAAAAAPRAAGGWGSGGRPSTQWPAAACATCCRRAAGCMLLVLLLLARGGGAARCGGQTAYTAACMLLFGAGVPLGSGRWPVPVTAGQSSITKPCTLRPQSNPELAPVYVDRSYARSPHICAGYFSVRSSGSYPCALLFNARGVAPHCPKVFVQWLGPHPTPATAASHTHAPHIELPCRCWQRCTRARPCRCRPRCCSPWCCTGS